MKLLGVALVALAVGCAEKPVVKQKAAASAKQAKAKQTAPAKAEPKPLTEDELFGRDDNSLSTASPLTREQYKAAEARQADARKKQKAKEDADALLSDEERETVLKIRAALGKHGLWGIASQHVVFAATGYAAPLLEDELIEASKRRDPSLEIDRLMDSLKMGSGDRIIFAASYDRLERVGIAKMLVALHDGSWNGPEAVLFQHRGKPFFDDAIKAYSKQNR